MPFCDLPDELLLHTANFLTELKHLNVLVKINRRNYHTLNLTFAQFADKRKFRWMHAKLLLDIGATQADKDDALYAATVKGRYFIMILLIQYGANVNAKMENGLTPLHGAVCVAGLWPNGVENLEERADGVLEGYNALHLACALGHDEVIEQLLDSGMDIECKTTDCPPRTPLMCAVIGCDFDPFLLYQNVLFTSPQYCTVPYDPFRRGSITCSTLFILMKRGADIQGLPDAARKRLDSSANSEARLL